MKGSRRKRPFLENSTACQKSTPNNNPGVRQCDGTAWFLIVLRRDSFGNTKSSGSVSAGGHSRDACAGRTIPPAGRGSFVCCVTGLPVGIYGEFDPGSGRTLAACLTHASRTVNRFRVGISGERVSNTWAICPALWDKPGKLGLIPDNTFRRMVGG